MRGVRVTNDGYGNIDELFSIEKIKGTDYADRVEIRGGPPTDGSIEPPLELDLGTNGSDFDVIDGSSSDQGLIVQATTIAEQFLVANLKLTEAELFLGSPHSDLISLNNALTPIYIGSSKDSDAVQTYANWSPLLNFGQFVLSLFVPSGSSSGQGLTDPLDTRFAGFERVEGSPHDDRLGLWRLNPGGPLTAGQEAALSAAKGVGVSLGNDPASVGALMDQRMNQAGLISQNQQDVLIDGGAGDDVIVGSRTGQNEINGGANSDDLMAGGFTSIIHGGEGNDVLRGGGFKSQLHGDAGRDTFHLSNHTFVMDATPDELAYWGPFRLTGGVQQWWNEDGWAYWAPFSSIVSGAPALTGSLFFGALAILDVAAMLTFRYTVTSGGQLVVQFARGRGQAVIENYKLDPDSGEATAGIVVFKQEFSANSSLGDFVNYINLALKAGFGAGLPGKDPLVLDLDGDGLEVTRPEAGVYFDLDNDDFAERTAWTTGDDGFLARDLNANGKIDDITELFGTASTPGFQQLAGLDSNADGKINAADTEFGTFRVWRDANSDGDTDAGELVTLAAAGISEISLATTVPSDTVRGNTVRAQATFTRTDGTTSTISDVLLQTNETDTRYTGPKTVSTAAAALPQLKGYGNTTDLRVAMTTDVTLLDLVSAFDGLGATTTWAQLKDAADDILYRWAKVDGIAPSAMGGGVFDVRKLAFLETYLGYELTPRDAAGKPSEINLDEIIQTWDDVLAKETAQLAAQGPLKGLFTGLAYDVGSDSFRAATASVVPDVLRAHLLQLPTAPADALTQWNATSGPLLTEVLEATIRVNGVAVKTDFIVQGLVSAMDGISSPLTLQQLAAGLALTGVQIGTGGADNLTRGSATNLQVFVGEAGDDTLTGGTGQDVYVFGRNFGRDTVIDAERFDQGDRIRLALLNPEDVTLSRSGIDLVISVKNSTDRITVREQFMTPVMAVGGMPISGDRGVEEIQFKDGTIWGAGEIAAEVGRGTDAAETLVGTGTPDEIEGLKGDDTLKGGDDGDLYYYTRGDGRDVIDDVMSTPLLNAPDTLLLMGGIGLEDLVFTRVGNSPDLLISFGGTGDSITIKNQFSYGSLGYDSRYALNSRIEAVFLADGPAMSWLDIQGLVLSRSITSGSETTHGFGTADQFYASAGDDTLIGYDGGDTYRFGRGSGLDIIEDNSQYPDTFVAGLVGHSWGAADRVIFGEGITAADVVFTRPGASPDLHIGLIGSSDTLTIKGQFAGVKLDLFGLLGMAWFDRVEVFSFADGSSMTWEQVLRIVTTGTTADDNLYGAFYADVIDGKQGNDFMSGGDDGDTYLFGRGYGQDVIQDRQANVLAPAADTVRFGIGITVSDVTFRRDGGGSDLLISIDGTTDTLRIQGQYSITETGPFGTQAFNQVERFEFADGTVRDWVSLMPTIVAAQKTAGADQVYGSHFNDTLDGGGGADRLMGGNGADTYVFARGYGADVVSDNLSNILAEDGDRIAFGPEILPGDISIERTGNGSQDLRLSIVGTTDSITIERQFSYTSINHRAYEIESFTFSNGVTWSTADVRINYLSQAATAGDDVIEGFWTNDIITGGAGNDVLRGGDGSDTYRFAAGFGQDTVQESVSIVTYDDNDAIEFGAGLLSANAVLTRSGADLTISFAGSTDRVTLTGQFGHVAYFSGWSDVETVSFADGVTWTDRQIRESLLTDAKTANDDVITGFYTGDVLDGGAGNDTLRGLGGGDTYLFGLGSGQDAIEESYGTTYENDPDTVVFGSGIARADVTFTRVGNDLRATIVGVADTLTIKDHFSSVQAKVELFKFADGSTFTAAQAEANALVAQSTSGNDTIVGTTGSELIDGGSGNDVLRGKEGSDTYVFSSGFGQDRVEDEATNRSYQDLDVIRFGPGLAASDATLTRVGSDLIISFEGINDTVTVARQFDYNDFFSVAEVVFGDGTQWSSADIRVKLIEAAQTNGADIVSGFHTSDVLRGGAGNDQLNGSGGGDTYLFERGFGRDRINESDPFNQGGTDVVSFLDLASTDVIFVKVNNDLVISFASVSDTLTITNQFYRWENVESFQFADGVVVTDAEIKVRVIKSLETSGADTIEGFGTDEVIEGRAGNDILRGRDGSDTYVFNAGFGRDVVEESVDNVAISNADAIRFGVGYDSDDVMLSRNGNDLTIGFEGSTDQVLIKGQFGRVAWYEGWADVETFTFGDSKVWTDQDIRVMLLAQARTSGDDTIIGYYGADILDGGAGNDLLQGLGGDDTYRFARGYGQDVIEESAATYDGTVDTVLFGSDVTAEQVLFIKVGNDLRVAIAATSDHITVRNFFLGGDYQVEHFLFADNTTLGVVEVTLRAIAGQATGGSDALTGTGGSDILDGIAGPDTLTAGGGDDTYVFGRGYGADVVDDNGNSTADQVRFNSGVLQGDLQYSRSGNDLMIRIDGTLDSLRIVNQFVDVRSGAHVDRIELFAFADGATLTAAAADQLALDALGASGADMVGYQLHDVLNGGPGGDVLDGGLGNDTYVYASGDGGDRIDESNAATLDVDRLQFTNLTSDQMSFARSGVDLLITITSTGHIIEVDEQFLLGGTGGGWGVEEIVFSDGTSWNRSAIAAAAPTNTTTADALVGTTGNDTLDGGGGDDTVDGRAGNDTLIGGTGKDQLSGNGGNDTYVFGRGGGQDTVIEYGLGKGSSGGFDTLEFNSSVVPSDVLVTQDGEDFVFRIIGTTDQIRLHRSSSGNSQFKVEQVTFTNGVIWTHAQLLEMTTMPTSGDDAFYGDDLANIMSGGAGNDLLDGQQGNDTLTGGAGDDTLFGGDGSDTYNWSRGDGHDVVTDGSNNGTLDKLVLVGVNPADVILVRSAANDVTLQVSASVGGSANGGSVRLVGSLNSYLEGGIEQVVFADGTIWTQADLRLMLLAQASTTGADDILGFRTADTLTGGLGNDTLDGGDGSDTYHWARGDGADVIADGTNAGVLDKLVLAGVNAANVTLARSADNDVTLQVAPSAAGGTSGGSIKLAGSLDSYLEGGVEQIAFADGATWTQADLRLMLLAQASTSGPDTVVGWRTADTLTGGAGNDLLEGRGGSDTYHWSRGHGADVITEGINGGAADKLVLAGINPTDVTLVRSSTNSVTLQVRPSLVGGVDGGSVQLTSSLDSYLDGGVEQIIFADGTTWTQANLRVMLLAQASTSGPDTIVGWRTADTLIGGAGNDTLEGGSGSDQLVGGTGRDTLTGGGDADMFRFTSTIETLVGSERDIITDFARGSDRIDLAGIDASQLLAGDQTFTWIGASAFSNTAGQLRYTSAGQAGLIVSGDTDGDGVADFEIQVSGTTPLQATDFLL